MTKYVNNNGVSEMWLNIKNWVTSQLLGYSQTGHTHSADDVSNVVTTNTTQTIGGLKKFTQTGTEFFKNIKTYHNLDYKLNTPPISKTYQYLFFEGNSGWYSGFVENQVDTNGDSFINLCARNTNENSAVIKLWCKNDNTKYFYPMSNNEISLGMPSFKWKEVYATTFYGGLIGNVTGNCSGTAGSVAWTNVTNKPSTFAPSSHTHSISDITDLETWNYDSNSNAIIVSGGTDTWSYDSQSNSIIVS